MIFTDHTSHLTGKALELFELLFELSVFILVCVLGGTELSSGVGSLLMVENVGVGRSHFGFEGIADGLS